MLILFIFFYSSYLPLYTQNLTENVTILQRIDRICSTVKDKIERKEFHLNEFKVNADYLNRHLPSVFQHLEKYYYIFLPQEDTNITPLLRSAVLIKEKENQVIYREFIYDLEENLVFYTEKGRSDNTHPKLLRKMYIQNGYLLHEIKDETAIGQVGINLSAYQIGTIWEESKRLLKKFELQFSQEK